MVVLHEDDRVRDRRLLDHGPGEPEIDALVLLEVLGAELRPRVRDVAEGPEPLVREPVVVASLLGLGEPQSAQVVGLVPGRNTDAVVGIHGVVVGRATAVGDPRARARAHDRFHRRDEAAGGVDHADRAVRHPLVDVGLTVRHDHDALTVEAGAKDTAKALGRPPSASGARLLRRQALHQFADVGEHGNEGSLGRGRGAQARSKRGGQVTAKLVAPGNPGKPRGEDGRARGQEADHGEHEEGRRPRLRGAPIDVAHVVDQGQPADGRTAVVDDGQHAHVNGAADQVEHTRAAGRAAAGGHRSRTSSPSGRPWSTWSGAPRCRRPRLRGGARPERVPRAVPRPGNARFVPGGRPVPPSRRRG